MKKLFTLLLSHFFLFSYSQTIIYQTEINKQKQVIKYNYLPISNKLIINEAFDKTSTYAIFNKSIELDSKSNSKIIYDNTKFLYLFSSLNNQDFGSAFSEGIISSIKMSFFKEKEEVQFQITNKNFNLFSTDYFRTPISFKPTMSFDKKYFYAIDIEGSGRINFEKDELKLNKFDISSKKFTLVSIKKPDIGRLKSKDLIVPGKIPFQNRFYSNNTFEIVTKSVKKDFSASSLYRDIYDLDGNFIKEIAYTYNSLKGYLVPSSTMAKTENLAYAETQNQIFRPTVLDINNYFIDNKTNDFYIYGLLDTKQSDGSTIKAPLGFYVIKFSPNGEKVWEKIYDLSTKEGFKEKGQQNLRVFINLDHSNSKDALSISIIGMNSYSNYYNIFHVISKENGDVIKTNSIDNKVETSKGTFSAGGKYSIFETNKYDKNTYLDSNTFLTLFLNDKIKKYIDKINSKEDVFFNSIVSIDGIWLLETDNKTYYKVLFF